MFVNRVSSVRAVVDLPPLWKTAVFCHMVGVNRNYPIKGRVIKLYNPCLTSKLNIAPSS